MNESKGNMYPDVVTWNPLAGECSHKCEYCSTNSLMRYPGVKAKYSGDIRLCNDLHKNFPGEPKTIFVVAQNDLFTANVPDKYIKSVLDKCNIWNQHRYLFQSKNPARFLEFEGLYPEKTILCTTIESNRWYVQMRKAPHPKQRAIAMNDAYYMKHEIHVTIEPIMDFDLEEMVYLIETCLPTKVNIGADSKRNNLPEPSKGKLLALIDELKKFTVIDQKRNLSRLLK
jgi:DNA repair photolyase